MTVIADKFGHSASYCAMASLTTTICEYTSDITYPTVSTSSTSVNTHYKHLHRAPSTICRGRLH